MTCHGAKSCAYMRVLLGWWPISLGTKPNQPRGCLYSPLSTLILVVIEAVSGVRNISFCVGATEVFSVYSRHTGRPERTTQSPLDMFLHSRSGRLLSFSCAVSFYTPDAHGKTQQAPPVPFKPTPGLLAFRRKTSSRSTCGWGQWRQRPTYTTTRTTTFSSFSRGASESLCCRRT